MKKGFYELTTKGKWIRCKKAMRILEMNHASSLSARAEVYKLYNQIMDDIEDRKGIDPTDVEQLRNVLWDENKHRGYLDYNPLAEVCELLKYM